MSGSFLIGIGGLVFFLTITYGLYQIIRVIKSFVDKEVKYDLFEEMLLEKSAKAKGLDLDKEVVKRDIFRQQSKSIRRKIREEIYDDMFGKEDKEDKKA